MPNDNTMQALVFQGPGKLSLRSIARPVPGNGEVLIRVQAAAICGTDLRIVAGRKTRDVRVGHPIGHECAGTVAAVGPGVHDLAPGDRIGVCVVVSCGQCHFCDADKENLCETRITLGYHTDGAFAEYMLIPAQAVRRGNLFKLPNDLPIHLTPLLEPLACCINGQHEMALQTSDSLVIFGAGPIGLLHVLLAKAYRAATTPTAPITVVEPVSLRRQLAIQFGADATYSPNEFNAAGQYDAAILAVGVPELVNTALRAVRKTGKMSLFAGFDQETTVAIDPNIIHYNQIRVTGASESRRRDYAEALSLVAQGTLDPSPLMTHRLHLENYAEAFRAVENGSALKVIFEL